MYIYRGTVVLDIKLFRNARRVPKQMSTEP